ncbi:Txndc12 [Symbiodinium sp. KB8]|nr:Txndc12 [Symbiodinium sp. KB8]
MRTGKPIMYLVHKSWCGACKGLKTHFKLSEDIAELSKRFVLVQFEDDEEPDSPNFSPDGRYVPRILFAEPSGKIRPDISNDMGNPKYKYFYANPVEVLAGMEVALQTLEGSGSPIESGEEAGGSHGSSETEDQDEL